MHWKLKAAIQNAVAALPPALSHRAYYWLQRRFGGYREITPVTRLSAGLEVASRIASRGHRAQGARFVEVGTGHQINLPLALWLLGAAEVVTVDVNPYVKAELVLRDVAYIGEHKAELVGMFRPWSDDPAVRERFERLATWCGRGLQELLDATHIAYLAPADAARLPLDVGSVDYHVSFTTLEHIPAPALEAILAESRRVLKPQGLFVHFVDFSDHFSHGDASITPVNFLQFSERQWLRYAGNRYMYQNRLRVDDFLSLVTQSGLTPLSVDPTIDQRSLEALRARRVRLDRTFTAKPLHINATTHAWVVAAGQ